MSEAPADGFSAKVVLSATEEQERRAPQWLAELAVLAEEFRVSGALSKLNERVHVPRGRAGDYETMDFVLASLAHAVSNQQYLRGTYRQIEGFEPLLAGLWGRRDVPSRSALSRWSKDVSPSSLKELGQVLFEDQLEHGVRGEALGGLYDRLGQRHVVFDGDGTRQAVRQRALIDTAEYPPARRRFSDSCAPGYGGRKRGELVCNRTVVQQAHTREWLGLFAAPGNGELLAELSQSCERIRAYMLYHQLDPQHALVRLDGAYGRSAAAAKLREAGLGFVLRCTDYRLLEPLLHNGTLEQFEPQRFEPQDSAIVRQLYDVGTIHWPQTLEPPEPLAVRLILSARAPHKDEQYKPKIGKRVGPLIYELFATSLQSQAAMASDVVSLYLGRGGFENTLREEDLEQRADRWVFCSAAGEAFWQMLNQWVWNARLRLGLVARGSMQHQTLWAEAVQSETAADAQRGPAEVTGPARAPQPLPSVLLPEAMHCPSAAGGSALCAEPSALPAVPAGSTSPAPVSSLGYELAPRGPQRPGTVVSANGRGAGRFAAEDFTWADSQTLLCPAGKTLRPSERRSQLGQERIRFEARASDCRRCAISARCLGSGNSARRGRRVSVIPAPRLGPQVPQPPHSELQAAAPSAQVQSISGSSCAASAEAASAPVAAASIPVSVTSAPAAALSPGPKPLLWVDLPATELRRFLPTLLLLLRFDLVPPLLPLTSPAPPALLSRAQRAHRRLTYRHRLQRNALPADTVPGSIHIHGLPHSILEHLAQLGRNARAA